MRLLLKRDDLIHPAMPGNKWRKLRLNIEEARSQQLGQLLTFGGAFSNHLYATASAGLLFGFDTIGVVRGEEHLPLNPVLRHCVNCGMRLTYLDRDAYREKDSTAAVTQLRDQFGEFYLVPEGGANEPGVRGCMDILAEQPGHFDYVATASGTGTTLAGLALAASARSMHVIGVAVLKGASFLTDDVTTILDRFDATTLRNWHVELGYHFGGYAKAKPALLEFIEAFHDDTGIVVDRIYVGKMLFALYDLLEQGAFERGQAVLAVHTGGLPADFD